MASYDDIGSGSLGSFGEVLRDMTINTAMTIARGLKVELASTNIGNFNKMNHDFMTLHMMRNAYERVITLNTVGENAYRNGDGDATATPAFYPSYTKGTNYMEFVTDAHDGSKMGEMTTRIQKAGGENKNLYLDDDNIKDDQVNFTGKYTDKNSILYKTKRLMRNNKLKTIISQFHTNGVDYNGQVGTKQFGESHGRNLLRKEVVDGGTPYSRNGYDDPYCRVWTHHYKYDNFEKTIRGANGDINTWENFFWGIETYDKDNKLVGDGHHKDLTEYGVNGENYDYAWRSKHNQDRRRQNSVLDPKGTGTNLVNITPKYLGGENKNIHTKSCMFSIENLAWKDYDPYSFEQALSWEQRGPFGGRIMWFPPYDIQIQETASAKWNSNEFIGRGEPVYTYVNSERTGNLSFLMLTDHPSSVDYASWWTDNDDAVENKGKDRANGNAENDYLRYFAGCFDGDVDNKNDMTGGLHTTPTYLTDEYINLNPPIVKPDKDTRVVTKQEQENVTKPTIVKFNVFFPNDYSGRDDRYSNKKDNSTVDAIMYLLFGHYTQKNSSGDIALNDKDINTFYTDTTKYKGYEMTGDEDHGISSVKLTSDIQMGNFKYRVDNRNKSEKLGSANYSDSKNYNLNYKLNNNLVDENTYTLAEVAAAFYLLKTGKVDNSISKSLINLGVNDQRVNNIYKIFKEQTLTRISCKGTATTHGNQKSNEQLVKDRATTIISWLKSYTQWNDIKIDPSDVADTSAQVIQFTNKTDKGSVSSREAKINRRAECTMEFSTSETVEKTTTTIEEIESEDGHPVYKGFTWMDSVLQPDGTMWHIYSKDKIIEYFTQEAKTNNNYDDGTKTDTPITDTTLLNIFKDRLFEPEKQSFIKTSPKYRGDYDNVNISKTTTPECVGFGFYIEGLDYSNDVRPVQYVYDGIFSYSEEDVYWKDNGLYVLKDDTVYRGEWDYDKFLNITNLRQYYNVGDIVMKKDNDDNEVYYTCLTNFEEKYIRYNDFDETKWDLITRDNISENLKSGYNFRNRNWSDNLMSISKNDIYYNEHRVDDKRYTEFKLCIGCQKPEIIKSASGGKCFSIIENWKILKQYIKNDYVVKGNDVYMCISSTSTTRGKWVESEWEKVNHITRLWMDSFNENISVCSAQYYNTEDNSPEAVKIRGNYYLKQRTPQYIDMYIWTNNLADALDGIVCSKTNPTGKYDGLYPYRKDDICMNGLEGENFNLYYKLREKYSYDPEIEFSLDDWEVIPDAETYQYTFNWELMAIVKKVAALLCKSVNETLKSILRIKDTDDDKDRYKEFIIDNNFDNRGDEFSCIWKYGKTNNLAEQVEDGISLVVTSSQLEPESDPNNPTPAPPIKFSSDENNYMITMLNQQKTTLENIKTLRTYVILYRLLDCITRVKDELGERDVCDAPNDENMVLNKDRYSPFKDCSDELWVDRSDGMLIQGCYLINGNNGVMPRSSELNKIRYDQEYYFYKQYEIDHPLMFEKLQKKLKYFNPAFHSMTPEGFNARCTFLQQCTRQGNTKTMSDLNGRTANNLAFGRPPYCVLRLGDFYYQMIVIDNITFDYNVSEGLQWDLNPEGNGVQPMLCKVNISFKFIGGGDITGPVQRLQNAMSFNYYANTSFYDNRADRVEYQPTNWATMGGAGNDDVDTKKSYAYLAKNYDTTPDILKPKYSDAIK